ncbi:MAG: HEAT repeat domain-containing protein [Promethearchaeia archaeon]
MEREEKIVKLHDLYSKTDEIKERRRILEILNRLSDEMHFEKFESYLLSDEDPMVRIEAAKILLFNYDIHKVIDPLLWIYEHDANIKLKCEILRFFIVLAEKNSKYIPKVKELLSIAIESKEISLKTEAICGFSALHLESSVSQIIKVLKSPNRMVQISALEALKDLRSKKTVSHLIRKLDSPRSDLWMLALNALKEIEKDNLGFLLMDTLKKLKNSTKIKNLKKGLIKALGILGRSDASELLLEFLEVDDYELRKTTELALDKITPKWRNHV